jgi:serine/threonine protein kinase
MAPEIIEGFPYSYPCDMWAMGIILYMALSKGYPFSSRNLENDIVNSPVLFLEESWKSISYEGRDLVD